MQPSELDQELISKTYNELDTAASSGYGKNYISYKNSHTNTVTKLQSSLYLFSAVKTYQQLIEMNNKLVDEKGKIRSFNDFKKEVDKVHLKYNKNHLQAEYQTANASSQMIRKWDEFQEQKEIYPNLEYITVGDDRVRESHKVFHGVIKPIDDVFWDTHYPPNGFRDRCTVRSTDKAVTTKKVTSKPDKGFSYHVGKTKTAFNEKGHPYFIIPKQDKKKMQAAFELSKLNAKPTKRYTSKKGGGEVKTSPFANSDTNNFKTNYELAIVLADKSNLKVNLIAQVDTTKTKNIVNTEYLINSKRGARKTPKKANYENTLQKVNNQESEIAVIDLSKNQETIENAVLKIDTILSKKEQYPLIKEVYIISADKKNVKHYKRK